LISGGTWRFGFTGIAARSESSPKAFSSWSRQLIVNHLVATCEKVHVNDIRPFVGAVMRFWFGLLLMRSIHDFERLSKGAANARADMRGLLDVVQQSAVHFNSPVAIRYCPHCQEGERAVSKLRSTWSGTPGQFAFSLSAIASITESISLRSSLMRSRGEVA